MFVVYWSGGYGNVKVGVIGAFVNEFYQTKVGLIKVELRGSLEVKVGSLTEVSGFGICIWNAGGNGRLPKPGEIPALKGF